ncbi:MAG: trypsin-like peptidase domain-containing protein [Atopobiaceae bacterium]|nr:trypsin-like peptidase domain-containing protein [Atopobiaceae bacterium]
MSDDQTNFQENVPASNDQEKEEAVRSLGETESSVQPTQVSAAAAQYVQQSVPTPQASQQPYQDQAQGVPAQQPYQGTYQQAQGRPVNPYVQQQQYAQARQAQPTQQSQPAQHYQQGYQQQYQRSYQQVPQQSYIPQQNTKPVDEKTSKSGLRSALFGLAGGAIGALAVSLVLQGASAIAGTHNLTQTQAQSSSVGQTISINPNDQDITIAQAVAAKALPSVVSVYVSSDEGEGLGSGVILDTDGNILTNWHVAGDATAISVTIAGKNYEATLVGGDASSDLAVVHADLQGDTVTPMEIGDSDSLVVGDWVMTIGSPFGLDQSVSAGIVSSLARNELMQSTYGTTIYANLIQTDASINPGNSGGALVNSKGQLVGVSTLFSSDTQSFAGIGFAIPGNYAIEIANKIIAGEQVTHAYIGLSMQTVTSQNAEANNLSVNQGAYVAEVTEGSPAAAAGIQKGDIVIAMGGQQITSADGMILAVRSHAIGETVSVTVMRGTEEMTFDVTLGSDEQLQALQQQQLEEQQRQREQYQFNPYGDGYGNGNGDGTVEDYDQFFEDLYDYFYNNNHGGSWEQ